MAFQSWGPRAVALGLTAVVHAYLVLFLHVDLAHVPPLLLSLPVAVAVVTAIGFWLIPERPLPAARRTVRAVERQGAAWSMPACAPRRPGTDPPAAGCGGISGPSTRPSC